MRVAVLITLAVSVALAVSPAALAQGPRSMSLMPSPSSPCTGDDASPAFRHVLAPATWKAADRNYAAARTLLDQANAMEHSPYEGWLLAVFEWNIARQTGDASHLAAVWEPLLPFCYTSERIAEMRVIIANPTAYR